MSELVVTILSVAVIAASSWALLYFSFRFALRWWIRRDLGDMPSQEELFAWYVANNAIVSYADWDGLHHSPTDPENPVVE